MIIFLLFFVYFIYESKVNVLIPLEDESAEDGYGDGGFYSMCMRCSWLAVGRLGTAKGLDSVSWCGLKIHQQACRCSDDRSLERWLWVKTNAGAG